VTAGRIAAVGNGQYLTHCGSCRLLIDDTLEDLPGVSRSHTELKAGQSTLWLDTTHTDPQQVVETIAGLGCTASVLS
jgi:copper chaperone CopZ